MGRTCRVGGHPTKVHHHCDVKGCPSSIDNCPNKDNHLKAQEGKR
jgi:hypothetical protein